MSVNTPLHALAQAIWSEAPADEAPAITRHPAFAVYRNTVLKGCVDALQANYPAVARLVGDDWFQSAATLYARTHPPVDGRLVLYGADFADFLARMEATHQLPYLTPVARLDRMWTLSHVRRCTTRLAAAHHIPARRSAGHTQTGTPPGSAMGLV